MSCTWNRAFHYTPPKKQQQNNNNNNNNNNSNNNNNPQNPNHPKQRKQKLKRCHTKSSPTISKCVSLLPAVLGSVAYDTESVQYILVRSMSRARQCRTDGAQHRTGIRHTLTHARAAYALISRNWDNANQYLLRKYIVRMRDPYKHSSDYQLQFACWFQQGQMKNRQSNNTWL